MYNLLSGVSVFKGSDVARSNICSDPDAIVVNTALKYASTTANVCKMFSFQFQFSISISTFKFLFPLNEKLTLFSL